MIKYIKYLIILFLFLFFSLSIIVAKDFQLDCIGDIKYSKYNFTDLRIPYNGLDGWCEIKAAIWIDDKNSISPYISIIPVYTSDDIFWWQRNIQLSVGLQWYPFPIQYKKLRSIRVFLLYGYRSFYDKPKDESPEYQDTQIGGDYYFDNLFNNSIFTYSVWSNISYRKTNFSLDDYKSPLWMGNIKIGPKFIVKNTINNPFLITDWTYVFNYPDRFWENFIRLGLGYQIFPFNSESTILPKILAKRLRFYIEYYYNVAWFGEKPQNKIKNYDIRFGMSFSTGGYYKEY